MQNIFAVHFCRNSQSSLFADGMSTTKIVAAPPAPAAHEKRGYESFSPFELYSRYALAGSMCAGLTHLVVVPMDVVKTRLQVIHASRLQFERERITAKFISD
mgnify:CR=1 FL=1